MVGLVPIKETMKVDMSNRYRLIGNRDPLPSRLLGTCSFPVSVSSCDPLPIAILGHMT